MNRKNLFLISLLFLASCNRTDNEEGKSINNFHFNFRYENIPMVNCDSLLRAKVYRMSYSKTSQGMLHTANLKFNNCTYYEKEDTLIVDFGDLLDVFDNDVLLKIYDTNVSVDYNPKLDTRIIEDLKYITDFDLVLDTSYQNQLLMDVEFKYHYLVKVYEEEDDSMYYHFNDCVACLHKD